MKTDIILVIGACGQIGIELTVALRERYGRFNVIAADKVATADILLDALDQDALRNVVRNCGVTQIYLLAGTFSTPAEQDIPPGWKLNIQSLLSVLEVAKEQRLDKVFWPSSIAVFGPGSPKYNCPQQTCVEPDTVYGISKRVGEYWCNYYFEQYGVDVRSLRFSGLVACTAPTGYGTTDYAVSIFHQAIEKQHYTCFLNEDTCLPMMYLPDAIRAILELMDAPKEAITIRTSYNLAGMSFAPCDLAAEIKKHIPGFRIDYQPDHREMIAAGWPASIKDEQARKDWGWQPHFDLKGMTADMLAQLTKIKGAYPEQEQMALHDFPDFPNEDHDFTGVFKI
ncbi:NAD-dependent epimerase/dehydratase family protein [Mucilaginibacter aquariorum]|uniref:NAD-dependent epimerase/dehydratase family protein n=1 Tax=Mucilaginibacter aquariorum TaxID=2967225 RepID=A0ABT1SXU8_9SPHI|nr:NAD-dependent epimerase/dehydratase family protein [Mucilaginibacter aquariorum]MCQ6957174.1 NAD-dependent epimerase/dehydratase family protein [Mucilaginibacter aquariorum]